MRKHIVILAGGLAPGLGIPVAAPGLRAEGLRVGLVAHGFDVTIMLKLGIYMRFCWFFKKIPALVRPPWIKIARSKKMLKMVKALEPYAVISINNQGVYVAKNFPGTIHVYDFFSAQCLERQCEAGFRGQEDEVLERTKKNKLLALGCANICILNGVKKMSYAQKWLGLAGKTFPGFPLVTVNMPVVPCFQKGEPKVSQERLKVMMAGYQHGWGNQHEVFDALAPLLKEGKIELHLCIHNRKHADDPVLAASLKRLKTMGHTKCYPPLVFEKFCDVLGSMDVFVDLYSRNVEREMAMVTRSVIALGCGIPVIHNTFTEVSVLVDEYQAGWLTDSAEGLVGTLSHLVDHSAEVQRGKVAARKLVIEKLSPEHAVRPLVEVLNHYEKD